MRANCARHGPPEEPVKNATFERRARRLRNTWDFFSAASAASALNVMGSQALKADTTYIGRS